MPNYRRQALDFRKDDVEYIMQRWNASNSCALVGIGSVGKSNLLHHLANEEVQAHYLGDAAQQVKAVIIDANMLGALPAPSPEAEQIRCWAGYELMMHRLYLAFYPLEILGAEDSRQFYDIYRTLQDGTNPLYAYMGLRYFELGLEYFMRRGIKIVFMFDEFEELLRHLPVKFFQALRGLRDSNKRNLMYLTFTRSPLETLVERYNLPMLDIESFIELFNDNLRYIGPYNETDAQRMLQELAKRSGKTYPEATLRLILQASGRYAGLLRASFHALEDFGSTVLPSLSLDNLIERLSLRHAIRAECQTIWSSLNPSEHHVLKAAAKLTPYQVNEATEQAVTMLVKKGLLRLQGTPPQLVIEPPLFRRFVMTDPA